MCIKMVVFATFWQQTFFTILFWTKWGKDITWCDPYDCCLLPDGDGSPAYLEKCCLLPDGDGSAAYQEKCDNRDQQTAITCGFCPDNAHIDSEDNTVAGPDYHVLENNTMQATLVCYLYRSRLSPSQPISPWPWRSRLA